MKDDVFFVGTKVLGFIVDTNEYMHNPYKCVWLPLPIDPVNPERGLIGFLNNYVDISNDAAGWVIRTGVFGNTNHYFGDTLYLALLKGLASQWRIEI